MGFANRVQSIFKKNREVIQNAKEKYDDREEPQESLVPIGGDFYATPDTPADPTDCDRYPDSPWCGENPIDNTPLAIGWDIVQDDCNFGVQLNSTLLFIKLPPLQVVHRNPACQLPPPPPPPPEELPSVADNKCARNACNDGRIITTSSRNADAIQSYPNQYCLIPYNDDQRVSNSNYKKDTDFLKQYLSDPLPPSITNRKITIESVGAKFNRLRGIELYPQGFEPNQPPNAPFLIKSVNQDGSTSIIEDTFTINQYGDRVGNIEYCHYYYRIEYDYPDGAETIHGDFNIGFGWIVTRFKKSLCEVVPDPPPPPEPPKKMDCCPELKALLQLTLKRIGNLPANVPDNFTKQKPSMINIESLAELMLWQMTQLDALMGSYPIEIEIEDADLVKEGNQKQTIKLPNQAESIAELVGLILTIKRDTHATLITAIKAMGESGMTKQLATKTLDVALANAEFLGYKLEQKKKNIPSLFTPGGKDISETLKEKNVEIITYENTDKKDLQDDIKTLLTMAARWNAQNWRKVGKDAALSLYDNLVGNVDIVKNHGKPQEQQDFNDFTEQAERGFIDITGISDTTDPWGRPYTERPKVREIGTDQGRYKDDGKDKDK